MPTKIQRKITAKDIFDFRDRNNGILGRKADDYFGTNHVELNRILKRENINPTDVVNLYRNSHLIQILDKLSECNGNWNYVAKQMRTSTSSLKSKFVTAGFDIKYIDMLFAGEPKTNPNFEPKDLPELDESKLRYPSGLKVFENDKKPELRTDKIPTQYRLIMRLARERDSLGRPKYSLEEIANKVNVTKSRVSQILTEQNIVRDSVMKKRYDPTQIETIINVVRVNPYKTINELVKILNANGIKINPEKLRLILIRLGYRTTESIDEIFREKISQLHKGKSNRIPTNLFTDDEKTRILINSETTKTIRRVLFKYVKEINNYGASLFDDLSQDIKITLWTELDFLKDKNENTINGTIYNVARRVAVDYLRNKYGRKRNKGREILTDNIESYATKSEKSLTGRRKGSPIKNNNY